MLCWSVGRFFTFVLACQLSKLSQLSQPLFWSSLDGRDNVWKRCHSPLPSVFGLYLTEPRYSREVVHSDSVLSLCREEHVDPERIDLGERIAVFGVTGARESGDRGDFFYQLQCNLWALR